MKHDQLKSGFIYTSVLSTRFWHENKNLPVAQSYIYITYEGAVILQAFLNHAKLEILEITF